MPNLNEEQTRERVLGFLRTGGVVVLPTDTLYGFSAAAFSAAAVGRIARLKRSGETGRYILLASSIEMVSCYVNWPDDKTRSKLARIWPAPLTAVLPAGKLRPPWAGDSIAFRVPALPPLLELIEQLGEPVVSTSVNRSGRAPLLEAEKMRREFGSMVDLVVSGEEESGRRAAASTVVDFTGERPVVVRRGDYDWEAGREAGREAGGGNPSK